MARPAPAGRTGRDATATARLAVRDLSFRYGDRDVLRQISLEVGRGEIVGLLGPNGAGKSTLFAILTGLLRPSAGTLLLDGREIAAGARALRASTGVVFQAPSLDAKLSALENLVLGGRLFGLSGREARARAADLLSAAGLSGRAGSRAGELSGGMRRRLELARALMHRPSILLMDEPTVGLDAGAFQHTWEQVRRRSRQEGLTVLLTTHRPDEAEACDRLVVLAEGRVVATGAPEALRARVRGDVVTVEADDPAPLAADIEARFGVRARPGAHGVHVERERGHELVPRLVEAFPPGRFRSVSIRRPTLADAFLAITGQDLEDES